MRTRHLPTTASLLVLALVAVGCTDDTPVAPRAATAAEASLASVGKGAHEYVNRVTTPFDVTMRAGTCGLTSDVRLVGEIHHELRMHEERDGGYGGRWSGIASGNATSADGATYRFRYSNRGQILAATALPTSASAIRPPRPFSAEIADHFHLVGQGTAPDLHVFQNFVVRFAQSGPPVREIIKGHGDPACDPI